MRGFDIRLGIWVLRRVAVLGVNKVDMISRDCSPLPAGVLVKSGKWFPTEAVVIDHIAVLVHSVTNTQFIELDHKFHRSLDQRNIQTTTTLMNSAWPFIPS
jgi:hypothetical protein